MLGFFAAVALEASGVARVSPPTAIFVPAAGAALVALAAAAAAAAAGVGRDVSASSLVTGVAASLTDKLGAHRDEARAAVDAAVDAAIGGVFDDAFLGPLLAAWMMPSDGEDF